MVRLQKRRQELGFTQKDVAAILSEVDKRIDAFQVSKYENFVCLPTPEQLKALCDALQASVLELYDRGDIDLLPGRAKAQKGADGHRSGQVRKCFRMDKRRAEWFSLDKLRFCGYNSYQSWFDACVRRFEGEYAAKIKHYEKSKGD